MPADPTDPVAFLDTLDSDAIAAEIAGLKSRQAALTVLLRAAKARQRGKPEKAKRGRPRREAVPIMTEAEKDTALANENS